MADSLIKRPALWLLAAVVLVSVPLLLPATRDASFKGTDDKAGDVIQQLKPGVTPLAEPFWTPPSKEIESLIFALQAAAGAGILGYLIGRRQGRLAAEKHAARPDQGA